METGPVVHTILQGDSEKIIFNFNYLVVKSWSSFVKITHVVVEKIIL